MVCDGKGHLLLSWLLLSLWPLGIASALNTSPFIIASSMRVTAKCPMPTDAWAATLMMRRQSVGSPDSTLAVAHIRISPKMYCNDASSRARSAS